MVAAGLTGVYAETIPNFEVLTLVVFGSGVLLGARDGALVGAVTMLVFSMLNPYGAVHPLVTAAQVAGMVPAGLAGAALGATGLPSAGVPLRAAVLGATGTALTVLFDLLTNLATGLLFGQVRVTLLGGIPFALWHAGTNAALFATAGVPLVSVFAHYRSRLS
uniref:ECF transporter S component n=1 Tax=Eiseniibacteriota bacterium TaxID=2212470 RepID=A0A832I3N0_UNCEI